MKKNITKIIFTILTTLCINAQAQTGQHVAELEKFDTAMLKLLSEHNVAGGQLAITYEGRIVYNRGFGYADTTRHTLVEPINIFRIASLSKPITAVTIMYLAEKRLLGIDDTVFGAGGILNDSAYLDIKDSLVLKITVRNLLNHTGGWDSNKSGDPMFNSFGIAKAMHAVPPANAETTVKYMLKYKMLDFEPGTNYAYSNFGFCILGRIIEKITGESYEDYVRNKILAACGITNMHAGFNINTLPDEVTYYDYNNAPYVPSVYDNSTKVPWPYGGFSVEAMDSYGGWVASAGDLCKLLMAIVGSSERHDILQPETVDIMGNRSQLNKSYGLGWSVDSKHNLWHRGSMPGTTTAFMLGKNNIHWALLLNSRPLNSGALNSDVDKLVLNIIPEIKKWPAIDVSTSTDNIATFTGIQLFPNPTMGTFTLSSNHDITNIEIFNELGQKMFFSDTIMTSGNHIIDISGFGKGVFYVRITSEGKHITKKLIKK